MATFKTILADTTTQLTQGGVIYGAANELIDSTASGTLGQVLTSAGSATPTWQTPSNGSVTSVSQLTLGTTGNDLSSTVANSTTTPVITLNVPDASTTARGVITIAAQTIVGTKTFSPTVTASGLIAIGTILTPTLNAAANNDVLVGLDIAPTFTNGAFTGVTNYAQRITGNTIQTIDGTAALYTSNVPSASAFCFHFSVPSTTNYFLRADGSNVFLNAAATAGTIFFRQGNASRAQIMPTTGNLILQSGGTFTDNLNNDRLQVDGNINLKTAGNKIKIATGSNASAGTATLVAGTIVVSTTAVTASSIILLTAQDTGTSTGNLRVSAKTAGTSFTILSTSLADTCSVGYVIIN